MNNLKFILLIGFLSLGYLSKAQKNTMESIETVIEEFAKAGDESNAKQLSTYLDDNYRVVMNRLFGSSEVSVLSKEVYLAKIEAKEFGGDERDLTIENITVNGTTASVKVTFKGSKMTFISLINLVQDANGHWKLISDTPVMQ